MDKIVITNLNYSSAERTLKKLEELHEELKYSGAGDIAVRVEELREEIRQAVVQYQKEVEDAAKSLDLRPGDILKQAGEDRITFMNILDIVDGVAIYNILIVGERIEYIPTIGLKVYELFHYLAYSRYKVEKTTEEEYNKYYKVIEELSKIEIK